MLTSNIDFMQLATPDYSGIELISLPVVAYGNDGRKIPDVDRSRLISLNVYRWRYSAEYPETVFVYSPFRKHPIRKKSITAVIDPYHHRFSQKHHRRAQYYLWRIFDSSGLLPDPIDFQEPGIVVFDSEIGLEDQLFFQSNNPNLDESTARLIQASVGNFRQYLTSRENLEVFIGIIDQLSKD